MVGLVAMVIAVFGLFLPQALLPTGAVSPNDGDATNYTKVTASQGLAVGTSQQFQVDSSGIVTAGNVSIPTAANATSTLTVGCMTSYATSSATSVKLKFLSVATTSANGFVTWSYGSCP